VNSDEIRAVLLILTTAYDRQLPVGLDAIWAATLDDIPYGLARETALELVKVSPYLPKVAEFRERARLVKTAHDREAGKRKQIEGRNWTPSRTPRTGADMIRHVLGRLKDAGQDPPAKYLGKQRAADIAEAACVEWLDRTAP
jgi:hypothetical protein